MTRFSMNFSAIAIVILLVGGSLAAETGSSKPQSQQGTSRSSSSSSSSGNSESSTGGNSAPASASSNTVPSSGTGSTNIHNIANRAVPVIANQQNSFNSLPRPLPSNTNFYTLSSVQRRRHTFRYQMPPKAATDNAAAASSTSTQPEFIGVPEKITIPIGVSNYKPIKYVDTIPEIKFVDFPTFPVIQPVQPIIQPVQPIIQPVRPIIQPVLQPVLLLQQPQLIQAPKSTVKEVAVSSVAKANEKRQIQTPAMPPMPNRPFQDKPESKPTDTAATPAAAAPVASDNSAQSSDGKAENTEFNNVVTNAFRHKPRMIELESSYIPLTLRFSTRPRKLNIIAADNDLIGQDSNRHDRINGKAGTIDLIDLNSGSLNLDTRTIFGTPRREEPLILKRGADSKIPENMQHIIKCIFPDFRFDGAEKVRSAC